MIHSDKVDQNKFKVNKKIRLIKQHKQRFLCHNLSMLLRVKIY